MFVRLVLHGDVPEDDGAISERGPIVYDGCHGARWINQGVTIARPAHANCYGASNLPVPKTRPMQEYLSSRLTTFSCSRRAAARSVSFA